MSKLERNELDTEIPEELIGRIEKMNHEYLVLLRDVARRDPGAAVVMGMKNDLVEIMQSAPLNKIVSIAKCNFLLMVPRINDLDFWKKVADGSTDTIDLIHQVLKEEF